MKKSTLYMLWACLFIICAGLGFIPNPTGALRILLTLISVGFFVPPALLVYRSSRNGDRHTVQLIRNLSALSLLLTLVLLILNFLSTLGSALLGRILYYVLVIISSPMVCCGYWALSLFLWACLLIVTLQQLRKK